jgi:hypothetical protein
MCASPADCDTADRRGLGRLEGTVDGYSDHSRGAQYLIDAAGVVYEGRWSGTASTSCATGGDGSDFGHGDGDQMVVGAHVGNYNSGNLGVSLLGTFTPGGAAPTAAAVDGLEAVLAELGTRHGLDPHGTVDYVNPANGYRKTVPTISAHRDWEATECPGDRLYAQLPDIRTAVAGAMAGGGAQEPPAEPEPPATLDVTGTDRGASTPLRTGPGQTMTVSGSGFSGQLSVVFEGGKGPAPSVTQAVIASDTSITATVSVPAKARTGSWDVRVSGTDGPSASCRACVQVQR